MISVGALIILTIIVFVLMCILIVGGKDDK